MMCYTVILEKGRESGCVAFCPTLKGCVAQGKTQAEAIKRLRQAMQDYIECLIEDGIAVPREIGAKTIRVAIEAA